MLCDPVFLLALTGTAVASQPVPPFPTTPVLPHPARSGYIAVDGVRLWYAEFGDGPPVILIEGGLDTTDDWAYLAPELAAHGYRAIVFDSRCQGRSTCSPTELGYRLMTRDTAALMTALHVDRASLIGYSDGGIIGLELAIYNPTRVVSLFAYGANSNPGTLVQLTAAQKQVEADSAAWSKRVYEQASPTPHDFPVSSAPHRADVGYTAPSDRCAARHHPCAGVDRGWRPRHDQTQRLRFHGCEAFRLAASSSCRLRATTRCGNTRNCSTPRCSSSSHRRMRLRLAERRGWLRDC